MRRTIFIYIVTLFIGQKVSAQSGQWVWMHGDSNAIAYGNYGTKGVASPTNTPPARYQAAYWQDNNGDFWIFGGVIIDTLIPPYVGNDLWKFSPITKMWTWMSGAKLNTNLGGNVGAIGIPSVNNYPRARGFGANCWTDNNNNLWLYAGSTPNGPNDELWKYNIATNEWTLVRTSPFTFNVKPSYGTLGVASPTNNPGSMEEIKSGYITADNKLWMFGGYHNYFDGTPPLSSQELWSYDISTDQWTWEKGSQNASNVAGTYGSLGIGNPSNEPPPRASYTKWKDRDDNFYVFSGLLNFSSGTVFNDVWKFDQNSKNWIWISGKNTINDSGTNANYCEKNIADIPQSRFENQTVSTKGCNRSFWNFGGLPRLSGVDCLNDLWLFNDSALTWTRVSGSVGVNDTGNYGIKGIISNSNKIPAKAGVHIWTDKNSNLWIFGGITNKGGNAYYSNDMWMYIPDSTCFNFPLNISLGLPFPPLSKYCYGESVTLDFPDVQNLIISPNSGYTFNSDSSKITFLATDSTYYTLSASTLGLCPATDTISFSLMGVTLPIADFAMNETSKTVDDTKFNFTNTSTKAIRYEWYYSGALISTQKDLIFNFPPKIGTYCIDLVAYNAIGCADTNTKCVTITSNINVIIPNVFSPNKDNNNDMLTAITKGLDSCDFNIYNRYGERIFQTKDPKLGWDGYFKGQPCDIGTYYYQFEYLEFDGTKQLLKGSIDLVK
jgi:gliding motility-associated-like protein